MSNISTPSLKLNIDTFSFPSILANTLTMSFFQSRSLGSGPFAPHCHQQRKERTTTIYYGWWRYDGKQLKPQLTQRSTSVENNLPLTETTMDTPADDFCIMRRHNRWWSCNGYVWIRGVTEGDDINEEQQELSMATSFAIYV